MTDTTKPNGDRDRPSDREAANNPRGPAMGPPEGTASSGSTSPPLDMALQRELAKEFGFYPATTNPEDIERHRRLNAAADAASAHGYRYDPCDRCGQATRYKQFPLVCRCTTPDRCPHPPIYVQGDHCQRCGGDARVPRENMHRLAKYIEEIWAEQEQKNAALRVPSGLPLQLASRYAAGRPKR